MALLIGLYHSLTAARWCEPFPLLFSKNNDTSVGGCFTFVSGSFIIGVLVEFVSQGSSSCRAAQGHGGKGTMRYLLINLNNTSTKLALADEKELLAKKTISTRGLSIPAVKRATRKWKFDRVLVGSVVPKKTGVFRSLFRTEIKEVTPDLNLGVDIDFCEPHGIGADRLANAVAVTTRYGSPAIVVDFGTAVTFDIISFGGVYEGGVIAPGLGVMTDYMYQRTALLPKIDLEEPVSSIGKTTRDAMLAGAIFGYRGLVRQIITEIVPKLEGKVRIVATGSYANLIAAKLPELQIIDLDLTFEGLRIIATRNFLP
jgi:type III pantothenate kinase